MRKITVIGSINIDLVATAERLPAPGETVLGGRFQVYCGGKGANQAVTAARLGVPVRLVASVGNDDYGRLALRNLAAHGVDARAVRVVGAPTGVALITVDAQGRNLITVAPGANERTRPRGRCDIAVMQLETPYVRPQARTLILNAAPAARVSLAGVDVLIVNEGEARLLAGMRSRGRSGVESLRKASRALHRRGAARVLITLGEKGVLDDGLHRPAFRVKPVDTVGAGDAFVGAFAAALASGHADPVRFAQAAAAIQCTRRGAQSGPTPNEVERLLR